MTINLTQLLSLIDLTRLQENDSEEAINQLCNMASSSYGCVAAICIYPQWIKQVKKNLADLPVKIATVVNFPHGKDSLASVLKSIENSLSAGAEEIDMVFPYTLYRSGEKKLACDFVRECKAICESRILKIILETGIFQADCIAEMAEAACFSGADFLKTSTGKINGGATLAAVKILLETIKKMPRSIGLKISGGVRTVKEADQYCELASQMMGLEWIKPNHFRIGASQLVNDIFSQV